MIFVPSRWKSNLSTVFVTGLIYFKIEVSKYREIMPIKLLVFFVRGSLAESCVTVFCDETGYF